jgi:hypothetical protein
MLSNTHCLSIISDGSLIVNLFTRMPDRYQANLANHLFDANLSMTDAKIPMNIKQALQSDECESWTLACLDELNSIKELEVYELVERIPGKKVIGTRWVFDLKKDVYGCIEKYKARSSLEAEYVAANETGREMKWTRALAEELGFKQRATILFEDNKPCILTASNPIINDRNKHIDIRYHWIRNEVKLGSLHLMYCPTADMVADVLTKPLGKILFQKHRFNLGVRSPSILSTNGFRGCVEKNPFAPILRFGDISNK